jgi:hypothetical protein
VRQVHVESQKTQRILSADNYSVFLPQFVDNRLRRIAHVPLPRGFTLLELARRVLRLAAGASVLLMVGCAVDGESAPQVGDPGAPGANADETVVPRGDREAQAAPPVTREVGMAPRVHRLTLAG